MEPSPTGNRGGIGRAPTTSQSTIVRTFFRNPLGTRIIATTVKTTLVSGMVSDSTVTLHVTICLVSATPSSRVTYVLTSKLLQSLSIPFFPPTYSYLASDLPKCHNVELTVEKVPKYLLKSKFLAFDYLR